MRQNLSIKWGLIYNRTATGFSKPNDVYEVSTGCLQFCFYFDLAQTGGIVAELLTYLIGFNSCLNPWIYFCFNCRNFVIKPRKSKMTNTNVTMTTQAQLNTDRASIQLSQSCSNKELHEETTPLTGTRALGLENGDTLQAWLIYHRWWLLLFVGINLLRVKLAWNMTK